MRRLIAIILLGGIMTQLFYSSGFLIDYYANSEAYRVLCKNKDKPAMNCDGKCILAQKIAASKKKQSQDENALPPIPIISQQYLVSKFQISFEMTEVSVSHQSIWYDTITHCLAYDLFKPPV